MSSSAAGFGGSATCKAAGAPHIGIASGYLRFAPVVDFGFLICEKTPQELEDWLISR